MMGFEPGVLGVNWLLTEALPEPRTNCDGMAHGLMLIISKFRMICAREICSTVPPKYPVSTLSWVATQPLSVKHALSEASKATQYRGSVGMGTISPYT